jgi:hypothetical protein
LQPRFKSEKRSVSQENESNIHKYIFFKNWNLMNVSNIFLRQGFK